MRAAIYLRISQDATGEAAGVTRQQEDCLALLESQGWDLHEIYVDNDISATSGKARPSYRKMLNDIKSGQVGAVVAWHPDRLYRKIASLEELISACEAHSVIMRTVRAGEIDLSTPTGRMIARIISATAQAEGEMKADRWKRSWRQGREAGAPAKTGSRLFGYTRDGQIIPEEAELMRWAAQEVLAGTSMAGVCRILDDKGVLTTRGSVWRMTTLRKYLSNPRIAGWSTLNGEIVAEGDWDPIIDRETWVALTALLNARGRTSSYSPRKALLNGVVHCGACGVRMVTGADKNRRSYRCTSRPDIKGCGGVSIRAEWVEEIAETYARERLDDPKVRARIAELRAKPAVDYDEIGELELRVRELEAELETPGVPVASIVRAIERAKEKQAALLADSATNQVPAIPTAGATWPSDLRHRRALVDLVVERIDIAKTGPSGPKFRPDRVQIVDR